MLWALLGLLAFAALAWFCVARHVPVLEQRLQAGVLSAIEPLNAGPVSVEMNGYTANLTGPVANSAARDNIVAAASAVAGVRTVSDNLQLVAAPVSANVDNTDSADATIVEPVATPAQTESTQIEPTESESAVVSAPVEPAPETPKTETTAEATTDEQTYAPTEEPTDAPKNNATDSALTTGSENAVPVPEVELPESIETAEISEPTEPTEPTETAPISASGSENNASASTADQAELNIAVNDRTLNLTGRIQDQRQMRPIVEVVMTTFDLNYVTNKIETTQSVGTMSWMDGLLASVPEMTAIENPSIDLFDEQITLSGSVNSKEEQDAIISVLQKNLPNLTVINRLRFDEDSVSTDTPRAETTRDEPTESDEIEALTVEEETAENEAAEAQKQAEIEEQFRIEAQKLADAEAEAAKAAAEEKAEQERAAAEAAEAAAKAAEAKRAEDKAAEAARQAAEKEKEAADAAEALRIAKEKEAQALAEAEANDPLTVASNSLSAAFDALPDTRILFRSGSDELTPDSEVRLDEIAELFLEFPIVPVDIKGHTDSQGDDALNLALSQLRANAVRDYLVSQGISVFRLSSFGFGESLPIDTNDTPEGRAANRRIEFSF